MFFTDPHLGVRRKSHTTTHSQKTLQDFIYHACLDLVTKGKEANAEVIIGGDLFDKYSNSEDIIQQGLEICKDSRIVVGGNHDQSNNNEKTSSLMLISTALEDQSLENPIIYNKAPNEPYCYSTTFVGESDVVITTVPHCITQELFEQSIDLAIKNTEISIDHNILLLHCNVGEAYGNVESEGTTLALTDSMQDKVAKHFDLVMVGHEHNPRTLKNGKIVVMGNIFPIAFGEMGDRYCYWYDTETNELTKETISLESEQISRISIDDLLSSAGDLDVQTPYIEFTGDIAPADYPAASRALVKFWKVNHDILFAAKSSFSVMTDEATKRSIELITSESLKKEVEDKVKLTAFFKEFQEIADELSGEK